jgi:hypothetical protein
MPLLAAFVGNVAVALAGFFSRYVAFELALKLAAYVAWIAVVSTFAVTVFVCVSGLVATASGMFSAGGSNLLRMFGMGLGMFIPANASTVLSCVASVWIGCQVYKLQKQGMHNYSK